MFRLRLMNLLDKIRTFSSFFKFTSGAIILFIILLLYMIFFITIPSIHTTGLSQLFWLFVDGLVIIVNIFLYEKSTHFDDDTQSHQAYHLAAIIMTVVIIGILMYQGYQSQSLYMH